MSLCYHLVCDFLLEKKKSLLYYFTIGSLIARYIVTLYSVTFSYEVYKLGLILQSFLTASLQTCNLKRVLKCHKDEIVLGPGVPLIW